MAPPGTDQPMPNGAKHYNREQIVKALSELFQGENDSMIEELVSVINYFEHLAERDPLDESIFHASSDGLMSSEKDPVDFQDSSANLLGNEMNTDFDVIDFLNAFEDLMAHKRAFSEFERKALKSQIRQQYHLRKEEIKHYSLHGSSNFGEPDLVRKSSSGSGSRLHRRRRTSTTHSRRRRTLSGGARASEEEDSNTQRRRVPTPERRADRVQSESPSSDDEVDEENNSDKDGASQRARSHRAPAEEDHAHRSSSRDSKGKSRTTRRSKSPKAPHTPRSHRIVSTTNADGTKTTTIVVRRRGRRLSSARATSPHQSSGDDDLDDSDHHRDSSKGRRPSLTKDSTETKVSPVETKSTKPDEEVLLAMEMALTAANNSKKSPKEIQKLIGQKSKQKQLIAQLETLMKDSADKKQRSWWSKISTDQQAENDQSPKIRKLAKKMAADAILSWTGGDSPNSSFSRIPDGDDGEVPDGRRKDEPKQRVLIKMNKIFKGQTPSKSPDEESPNPQNSPGTPKKRAYTLKARLSSIPLPIEGEMDQEDSSPSNHTKSPGNNTKSPVTRKSRPGDKFRSSHGESSHHNSPRSSPKPMDTYLFTNKNNYDL